MNCLRPRNQFKTNDAKGNIKVRQEQGSIMNFKYGKKEMEYLKSRDRRLGEVIDPAGGTQK